MNASMRPFFAAVLSLFIAGLGQAYLGEWRRGAVFIFLEFLTSYLLAYSFELAITLNLALSLFASFDAYRLAKKKAARKEEGPEIEVVFTR